MVELSNTEIKLLIEALEQLCNRLKDYIKDKPKDKLKEQSKRALAKGAKQTIEENKCVCVDCGAELEIDTEEDVNATLRCPECWAKMEKETSLEE